MSRQRDSGPERKIGAYSAPDAHTVLCNQIDHDGYDYKASAGMSTNYGTNLTTSAVGDDKSPTTPTGSDAYFSTVEVSRKKARDEAIEVLNAVVRNDKATEDVKAQAMQELQALAKDMEKEANIESLLQGKGFAKCLAVISGDNANIVVQNKGALQPAQLAQINAEFRHGLVR